VAGLSSCVADPAARARVCVPWAVTGLAAKVNVATGSAALRLTLVAAMPLTVSAPACQLGGGIGSGKVSGKVVGGVVPGAPLAAGLARTQRPARSGTSGLATGVPRPVTRSYPGPAA